MAEEKTMESLSHLSRLKEELSQGKLEECLRLTKEVESNMKKIRKLISSSLEEKYRRQEERNERTDLNFTFLRPLM